MKWQEVWVVLLILCFFLVGTVVSGCGNDAPPTDNIEDVNQDNQDQDVGHDADDTDDVDENAGEMYGTGEACPQSCDGTPGGAGRCDLCEEGWCVRPGNPVNEIYCSRRCDGEEDCADDEWECIDNFCVHWALEN